MNNTDMFNKPENNSISNKINDFEDDNATLLLENDFKANNMFKLKGKFPSKQLINLNHKFSLKDNNINLENEAVLNVKCDSSKLNYRLKLKPDQINHHLDLGFFKKQFLGFNYWFNPYLKMNHNNKFDNMDLEFGKILTFKNYTSHYSFNFNMKEKCPTITHNSMLNYKNILFNYIYSFNCKNTFVPIERSFKLNYSLCSKSEIILQGLNKNPSKAFKFDFNDYNLKIFRKINKNNSIAVGVNINNIIEGEADLNAAIGYERIIGDHRIKAKINTENELSLFSMYRFCCGSLLLSLSNNFNNNDTKVGFTVDYFD